MGGLSSQNGLQVRKGAPQLLLIVKLPLRGWSISVGGDD